MGHKPSSGATSSRAKFFLWSDRRELVERDKDGSEECRQLYLAKTQVRRESRLASSRAYELCRTGRMGRTIQLVRQDCITQRRRHLPLLKAQPKQPKSATIQVRVEEDIKLRLEKSAEFIDSSPAYVVTEALKLLFHKDREFKSWLGQYSNNSEAHCPTPKALPTKGESIQLALK
jgi:hypothetical protein